MSVPPQYAGIKLSGSNPQETQHTLELCTLVYTFHNGTHTNQSLDLDYVCPVSIILRLFKSEQFN